MNELDEYHDASHAREYRPSEWRAMLRSTRFGVEELKVYTRHRPLKALTDGVSEDNVHKIRERLDSLSTSERQALSLTEEGGDIYLNHWFVMIAATKE